MQPRPKLFCPKLEATQKQSAEVQEFENRSRMYVVLFQVDTCWQVYCMLQVV